MSRTNRRNVSTSPISKYIEYKGSGVFSYYDKESEENIKLKKLELILLDERSSITGWFERNDVGTQIASNFVKNINEEELEVRASKNKHFNRAEVLYKGVYDRKEISNFGGKFTTNLFALVKIDDEWEVAKVEIKGWALKTWTDIKQDEPKFKSNGIYDYIITLKKGDKKKKGATIFYGLDYSIEELSEDLEVKANSADEQFLEWIDSDKEEESKESEASRAKEEPTSPQDSYEDEDEDEEEEDDLPF